MKDSFNECLLCSFYSNKEEILFLQPSCLHYDSQEAIVVEKEELSLPKSEMNADLMTAVAEKQNRRKEKRKKSKENKKLKKQENNIQKDFFSSSGTDEQPIMSDGIDYIEGHINEYGDDIKFILRFAKQRCSKCFVSHLPKDKWCLKEAKRDEAKKCMAMSLIEEMINKAVDHSETSQFIKFEIVGEILEDLIQSVNIGSFMEEDSCSDIVSLSESVSSSENTFFQEESFNIIHQLDGVADVSFSDSRDESFVERTIGRLDCADETINKTLTLLRGFESIWPFFNEHKICKHTDQFKQSGSCILCLLRSFNLRINNVKPKAHKIMKPTELDHIVHSCDFTSVDPINQMTRFFVNEINSYQNMEHKMICSNCSKYVTVPQVLNSIENNSNLATLPDLIQYAIKSEINCDCLTSNCEIKMPKPTLMMLQFEKGMKLESVVQSFTLGSLYVNCLSFLLKEGNSYAPFFFLDGTLHDQFNNPISTDVLKKQVYTSIILNLSNKSSGKLVIDDYIYDRKALTYFRGKKYKKEHSEEL